PRGERVRKMTVPAKFRNIADRGTMVHSIPQLRRGPPMAAAKFPPGPKGLVLLGNVLRYARDPLGYIVCCAREFGDIFRINLLGTTIYTLTHPDHIEYVLRINHRNFVKDFFTHQVSRLLGQGLLTNEGESWRRQRQLAQPAFQLHQLQRYGAVMVEATERMLQTWRDGAPLDIHQEMMRLTLRSVARALLGSDVAGTAAEVGDALEAAMKHLIHPLSYTRIGPWLPTAGNFRFRRAVRQLDRVVYGLIRQR